MSARAKRRACCLRACTMNGWTGRSGPVMRCPGGRAPPVAAGAGGAGDAGDGGEAGGAGGAAGATRGAAEAAGSGRAANGAGAGGGRNTGAAGGAGRGGGAARAGGAAGAGGAGGAGGGGGAGRGATNGPDRRGGAGGAGGGGREAAVLIRDDTDRQRHQRHAVQLAAAVLPKVVPSAAVLFVVLVRDERVEHLEHIPAHVGDRLERNHADEVVASDVPHEAAAAQLPLHHVVEAARQDVDDTIAVVVAVAIVVLLEVIEVGVAHREQVTRLHAPPDLALDLRGTGQAGGGIHRHVPRRAREQAR